MLKQSLLNAKNKHECWDQLAIDSMYFWMLKIINQEQTIAKANMKIKNHDA